MKDAILLVADGILPNSSMNLEEYNALSKRLNVSKITSYQIHKDLCEYFKRILNDEDCSSVELITRTLGPELDFNNTYIRKQFTLIQNVSLAYISLIRNLQSIKKQETSYQTNFVHDLCTAITDYIHYPVTFYPGETPLSSMSKYLKSKNIIVNECEAYKADDILSYNDIEIFVNEISGPFANTHQI